MHSHRVLPAGEIGVANRAGLVALIPVRPCLAIGKDLAELVEQFRIGIRPGRFPCRIELIRKLMITAI